MVLEDSSFEDMTLEAWSKAVKPKVDGTLHLDNVSKGDNLEFFVCFSSVSSVTGAVGQANYAAANLFMASIVEQRRRRGVAASMINIGPILGVGYISRADVDLRGLVQSGSYMCISEQDFHQLFGEAVVAGRPTYTGPYEITSGLAKTSLESGMQPSWTSNPLMSHHVMDTRGKKSSKEGSGGKLSISDQIAQATNKTDLFNIIKSALISKISALFQLDIAKLSSEDPANLHLDAMGADSLLAVEMRGWFSQTFEVNVPVLKILSGTSVAELVHLVIEDMSEDMTPAMSASGHDKAPTAVEPPRVQSIRTNVTALDLSPSLASSFEGSTVPTIGSSSAYDTAESSPPLEPFKPEDIEIEEPTPTAFQRRSDLSYGQELFWFVSSLLQDSTSLNHTGMFRLSGNVRVADLKRAVKSIGQRHEALRTCFSTEGGHSFQGVLETAIVSLEHRNITSEAEAYKVVDELQEHIYDMTHGETYRLLLLTASPEEHYLAFGTHSLMADGLSLQVFLSDLQQFYTRTKPSTKCFQFIDHATHQRQDYTKGVYKNDLAFWRTELADMPASMPVLSSAKSRSRPSMDKYENLQAEFRVDAETKSLIQALCRRIKVTPFHYYLSVFRAFLARHTGANDFSIGVADANRPTEELMAAIGPFLNLLPIRFQTEGSAGFSETLSETKTKTYEALSKSGVPFQILLNE